MLQIPVSVSIFYGLAFAPASFAAYDEVPNG
jgi:hypothetical protein